MKKPLALLVLSTAFLGCTFQGKRGGYWQYQGTPTTRFTLSAHDTTDATYKNCGPFSVYSELEFVSADSTNIKEISSYYEIGLHIIQPYAKSDFVLDSLNLYRIDSIMVRFDGLKTTLSLPIMELHHYSDSVSQGIYYRFHNMKIPDRESSVTLVVSMNIQSIQNSLFKSCDTLTFEYLRKVEFPNPFSPTSTIRYSIPDGAHVTITIFDAKGERVGVIVDKFQPKGIHEVFLVPYNLPSGVYFYKLQAGQFSDTRKIVLLR